MHVEWVGEPRDSTSVLEALPGIHGYQLPLMLITLLHVDLINVAYLMACLSGHHDVALLERRRQWR